MDLREKPGKIQKCLELSCRFRLIFLVLAVVISVSFVASGWQAMCALPLGASEALGMWMANFGTETMAGAEYLGVAALAMFVMAFVFGGVRSGIGAVVAAAAFVGSLVLLDGAEGMQTASLRTGVSCTENFWRGMTAAKVWSMTRRSSPRRTRY